MNPVIFRISDEKYLLAGGYAGDVAKCELKGDQERPEFCDDENIVTSSDRLAGQSIVNLAWMYDKEGGWERLPSMSTPRAFHQCSLMQKKDKDTVSSDG